MYSFNTPTLTSRPLSSLFSEPELWYLAATYSMVVGYYSSPNFSDQHIRPSLPEYCSEDEEKACMFRNMFWEKLLSLSKEEFTEFLTTFFPTYLATIVDSEDTICILYDLLCIFFHDEPRERNRASFFFSNNPPLYRFCMSIFRHVQSEWMKRDEKYFALDVERAIHQSI
jgi:hypothetical protein